MRGCAGFLPIYSMIDMIGPGDPRNPFKKGVFWVLGRWNQQKTRGWRGLPVPQMMASASPLRCSAYLDHCSICLSELERNILYYPPWTVRPWKWMEDEISSWVLIFRGGLRVSGRATCWNEVSPNLWGKSYLRQSRFPRKWLFKNFRYIACAQFFLTSSNFGGILSPQLLASER